MNRDVEEVEKKNKNRRNTKGFHKIFQVKFSDFSLNFLSKSDDFP